jgi:hypothetical protein
MKGVIEGTQVPISELADLTDWITVKKVRGSTHVSVPPSIHPLAVQQIEWRPRHKGNAE